MCGMLEVAVGILAGVFLLLYYLLTRHYNFWKKHDIPFLKPELFFGNLRPVALQKVDIGRHLKDMYDAHKDTRYIGMFAFHRPALLVRDLELARDVLVKDAQHFVDRNVTVDQSLDPLNGKAIFALKGHKWRQMRLNLTPMFTSGKMKKIFSLVNKLGQDLVRYLDKVTVKDPRVEVKECFLKFTIDVMSSCVFGIECNSLTEESADFSRRLRSVFEFSALQGLANLATFFAPALHSLLRVKVTSRAVEDLMRNAFWSTIHYREKNGVDRKDFLDVMMGLRKKGEDFDGDNLTAQAFAFLTAGFDTSGTTMTLTLYELALHPEIQSRLRTEIRQVLEKNDDEVTYEAIQEMAYLEMVISEILRKYAVVPFLERNCTSDYKLPAPSGEGSRTLRAGTGVYIPVLGFHHNPEYFPEPEKYDPERFNEENKRKFPQYAYLPFGEGPRNCIGMRFAMLKSKAGLVHVLSSYEVTPSRDTPPRIKINPRNFIVQAEGEVPLSFRKISK